jgi:hypothetical protein
VAELTNLPLLTDGDQAHLLDWALRLIQALSNNFALLGLSLNGQTGATGATGAAGAQGPQGPPGEGGNDWADIVITAAGTYVLDPAEVNKTLFIKNASGAVRTVQLPVSQDGDWLVVMNRSFGLGSNYSLNFTLGTDGSGALPNPLLAAGGGAIFRCNGMGGWLVVVLLAGSPGTRL